MLKMIVEYTIHTQFYVLFPLLIYRSESQIFSKVVKIKLSFL